MRNRPARIQTRIAALSHSGTPCHSAPPALEDSPFDHVIVPEPYPFASRCRSFGRSGVSKRKKTLLALLEELSSLRDEVEGEERQVVDSMVNYDRIPSNEGIEKFQTFDECINHLGLKLQSFSNVLRQLPSSAGLLNATNLLWSRLPRVRRLFKDNASRLFDTLSRATDIPINPSSGNLRRGSSRRSNIGEAIQEPVDTRVFPAELESLASDLNAFVDHLKDVPEFTDESVHATHREVITFFTAFEKDLRYRAACLEEFEDRLLSKDMVIASYINDLTEDMVLHMTRMRDALNTFIEVGVPAIRHSKQHMAASLQNLSTVATFFSGVTATTLQFTFEHHGSRLPDLVNALWISSLVFSISSAINAQLAYHWRAAMYRSPKCYVPWLVLVWIVYTPLVFLVVSSAAFSIGLCVFTYSSGQSPAVRALVTSFTAATSSGLLLVGVWFAFERRAFMVTNGSRWLLDILSEHLKNVWKSVAGGVSKPLSAAANFLNKGITSLNQLLSKSRAYIVHMSMDISFSSRIARERCPDTEAQHSQTQLEAYLTNHGLNMPIALADLDHIDTPPVDGCLDSQQFLESDKITGKAELTSPSRDASTPNTVVNRTPCPENAKFKALVRRVIHLLKIAPQPWPEHWSDFSPPIDVIPTSSRDIIQNRFIPQNIRTYVTILRTLYPVQVLNEHLRLVKHMEFSSNGQFLATCSWDRTVLIWKVGQSMKVELMHSLVRDDRIGGVVSQVAWGIDEDQLLTKQQRYIRLWAPKTRVCWRTFRRDRDVRCIAWMPCSRSQILSVEWDTDTPQPETHACQSVKGSNLVLIHLFDRTEQTHQLERLQVWDAKVMPDGERVVCVATLLESPIKDRPVNSRYEKRILIYNFRTKEVESQVPLLRDTQDIALAALGNYALVSYEDKAPAQAWRINEILEHNEDGSSRKKCQLKMPRTYATKTPVDFVGASSFGGPKDTFVLAASRVGEIYIWERSSGNLLHTLPTPSNQELQVTSLAWNRESPHQFMLASGARDGTVRMWIAKSPYSAAALEPSEETASEGSSPAAVTYFPKGHNHTILY